jgi:gliding motility-associated-like protein
MILRALIFFIFSGTLVITAYAQYPSVNGRFEFDKINGCAPLTVNIDAPECLSTSCNIDFGDGSGGQPMVSSYTYTAPGTYTARIIFGASGSDVITVQVLPDIQPEFDIVRCAGASNTIFVRITDTNYDNYTITYSDGASVTVPSGSSANDSHAFATSGAKSVSVKGRKLGFEDNCTARVKNITIDPALIDGAFTQLTVLNETSIQLGMTMEQFTQYRLEIATNNSTTWQNLADIYGVTEFTVNNLLTDNNFYCFRIATFDPCSNSVTGYSDPICSANFDVTADNRFNRIEWLTSSTGISGYSISKAAATTTFPPLITAPPAASLDDSDVDCTVTYAYQLVATYANGSTSTSLSKEVTSISTTPPPAVQNITASVAGPKQVDLTWTQDPDFPPASYELFRSALGFTTKIAETSENNFIDAQYNAATPTCYRIRYEDVCGNESSVSVEACPIMLTGYVNRDNSIQLSWTPYSGWAAGPSAYTIEKYDTEGQLIQSFNVGNVTSFLDDTHDPDNQVYNYIVVAIPTDPTLVAAASNSARIIKESNVFYPNAFTPNGDDLNDTFLVSGQFIAEFEMKVFNRWGELLFTSNDPSLGWDGTARGNLMPEGTYVFVAKITDLAGRTFERTGSILLLKKN